MAKGKDRDVRREKQWRRIIKEHIGSGLTIREFCRKSKVPETAFYFWRRELQRRRLDRREAEQEQRQHPTFLPVRLAQEARAPDRGDVEIALPGGVRVHVTAPVDRQTLADVLSVLEGRPC
jgi:transposase-like protein